MEKSNKKSTIPLTNPFELEVVSIRLVKDAPICSGHPITKPEDAVELVGKYLCEMDREVLCVINLKTDGTPINCNIVSIGAIDETVAHPREIFKSSILCNASRIMLVHNHPSSNLEPSKADVRLTDRMIKVGDLMGIPLIDHIIVGGNNSKYFSLRAREMLKSPDILLQSNYRQLDFESQLVAEKGKSR
ncbi:JAB domain-containing protein [Anaerosporobacter sp.]|uniref:JAB domain-containing protein n=1 Tax=Anaerosporobacter sp. TaxID=1872529 RepID=UPI002F417A9A